MYVANKKDSFDYVDLAFPLLQVGPVARFTVSKLSIHTIQDIHVFLTLSNTQLLQILNIVKRFEKSLQLAQM